MKSAVITFEIPRVIELLKLIWFWSQATPRRLLEEHICSVLQVLLPVLLLKVAGQ